MILVLAGTLEGRKTAELLNNNGFAVAASVVTDYGGQLLDKLGLANVYTGSMDEEALMEVLRQGVALLVDATHPFAAVASQTAIRAAKATGTPYLRLERPGTDLPAHPLIVTAETLSESIDKAIALGRIIFSTLGSKALPALLAASRQTGSQVIARVLPDSGVIAACLEQGLTPAQIIALQGPCSKELNAAMYRQYEAQVVLTKDSGSTGGVREKIAAALEVGIPIVIWQRPRLDYPLVVNTPAEVLEYCIKTFR